MKVQCNILKVNIIRHRTVTKMKKQRVINSNALEEIKWNTKKYVVRAKEGRKEEKENKNQMREIEKYSKIVDISQTIYVIKCK